MKPEHCKILGFTRSKPVDLIISTLAVAPPQIRPSIEMNPEKKAEDEITSAYVRIVSINNELKSHVESSERQNKVSEMEKIIASIMVKVDRVNLQKPGGKKKKAMKKIKSIEERLKSKEGRFRQHLMGKRVDFSARSVVSPDSNLALDELGVPEKIAAQLTIPEEVTEYNYERMVKLCLEGKVKYIIKPSEDRRKHEEIMNLMKIYDKPEEIAKVINYGTIVERNLENGDYVLFNRQPTLHRMSMMGHRVRILPYNTFRLNLSVCAPYNADFDGD
jgi:DNA-directed RNA polymerase beta' subunit